MNSTTFSEHPQYDKCSITVLATMKKIHIISSPACPLALNESPGKESDSDVELN